MIAQVIQCSGVHIGDSCASPSTESLDIIGVEVHIRQVIYQWDHILRIVVIPCSRGIIACHQPVGVAVWPGWVVWGLELRVEPPQGVGYRHWAAVGGNGPHRAWYCPGRILRLIEVRHARGGIVLPRTGLPVEHTPIGGGDQGTPRVRLVEVGASGPEITLAVGRSQSQTKFFEGARGDAQLVVLDRNLGLPATADQVGRVSACPTDWCRDLQPRTTCRCVFLSSAVTPNAQPIIVAVQVGIAVQVGVQQDIGKVTGDVGIERRHIKGDV